MALFSKRLVNYKCNSRRLLKVTLILKVDRKDCECLYRRFSKTELFVKGLSIGAKQVIHCKSCFLKKSAVKIQDLT